MFYLQSCKQVYNLLLIVKYVLCLHCIKHYLLCFSQYHISTLVLNKSKVKEMESFAQNFIDQKSRIAVAWVWRWEWKLPETGHEESNWWDGNILNMIYGIPLVYLWYIACIFTKITELYTWIGWMLCCRKYTTLKTFKEKKTLTTSTSFYSDPGAWLCTTMKPAVGRPEDVITL